MGLITDWQIRFLKISLHGILFQKMGNRFVFSHGSDFWQDLHIGFQHYVSGGWIQGRIQKCGTGEVFGGDELMYAGITIPRVRQDFSATMIIFEKM